MDLHSPSTHAYFAKNVAYLPFYRAMLCIRGTRHGPVSVCVCLCLCLCLCPCLSQVGSSTKTAKRTALHDSPGSLVFLMPKISAKFDGVPPYEGAKCRWGGSKSATFDK